MNGDPRASRYAYYPCSNCGQSVAHMANGDVLHMHRGSEKCRAGGAAVRRAAAAFEGNRRRTGRKRR